MKSPQHGYQPKGTCLTFYALRVLRMASARAQMSEDFLRVIVDPHDATVEYVRCDSHRYIDQPS